MSQSLDPWRWSLFSTLRRNFAWTYDCGFYFIRSCLAPIDMMIGSWKGFVSARGQYARLNEAVNEDTCRITKNVITST